MNMNLSVYQKAIRIVDFAIEADGYVSSESNNKTLIKKAIIVTGLFDVTHQAMLRQHLGDRLVSLAYLSGGSDRTVCDRCDGDGHYPCYECPGDNCPDCDGYGYIECEVCGI